MTTKQRWTILKLIQTTTDYFMQKGVESPRIDAEILLAGVLGKRRIDLYVAFDQPLGETEVDRFREMVRSRAAGMPVQRILGETEFYSLTIDVSAGVFIPRAETELLVDEAIAWIREQPEGETIRAADICTGSGAVAVAIARNADQVVFDAVDLSEDAAECARANAVRMAVDDRVNAIAQDGIEFLHEAGKPFDLIVCNPPYLTTLELDDLPREVADHDPPLALHGGADGLEFYSKLAAVSGAALRPGGAIFVEASDATAGPVGDLFTAAGLVSVRIRKDYAGHDRIVAAVRTA